jgi:hypothetical protein
MLRKLTFVQALGICFFSGCVYSVHPILTDCDLTTDFDLSGTWVPDRPPIPTTGEQQELEAERSYTFVASKFSNGSESDYDVVWNGKRFHGQIGKIGDDYFLQLKRTELTPEIVPLLHAVPVYAIARLKIADDETLEVFTIDAMRAPRLMEEHQLAHLRYSPSGPIPYLVLTGSTKSMQSKFERASDQIFAKRTLFNRTNTYDEPADAPKDRSSRFDN